MKRLLSIILIAASVMMQLQAQVLYKISGNGLEKESYLLGTCHVVDGAFVDSIPGAKEILGNIEQVCGELDMNSMFSQDSIAILQSATLLPDNKTLKDIMSEEEFKKLDELVEKLMGLKLSNPMIYGQMGKMKPMTIETTLTMLMCLKYAKHPFNPQNGIDTYVQNLALQAGKKVTGLESIAFQIETLYGAPIEKQVKELNCFVEYYEIQAENTMELMEVYYAQDIEGIHRVMNAKMNNACDATEEDMERLIYSRNDNWMKLLPGIMKANSTLVAVGAGHLTGERGLLAQLKKAGYTVEGVK